MKRKHVLGIFALIITFLIIAFPFILGIEFILGLFVFGVIYFLLREFIPDISDKEVKK